MLIQFTILGEPASKANSRQIVLRGSRPSSIKSEKARNYEADALKQIPPRFRLQLTGAVRVTLRIFYATQRPDLDESVVLDVLQDRYEKQKLTKAQKDAGMKAGRFLSQRGVYVNDRQVREKHVFHGIDKANPRTEVIVEPLEARQTSLELPTPRADLFDPLEI